MKMEDILVEDGRIVAMIDFENFQINVPELLKLYSPLQFDEEMDRVFMDECERLGVRAWLKTNATEERYKFCLHGMLVCQNIVPGGYDSFRRNNDLTGLKRRLAEARNSLLSTLNTI